MWTPALMGLRNPEVKGDIEDLFTSDAGAAATVALLILVKDGERSHKGMSGHYRLSFIAYLQHIEFFGRDSILLSQELMKIAQTNGIWPKVRKSLDTLVEQGYLEFYIKKGQLHSFSITDKALPEDFSATIGKRSTFTYGMKTIATA